MPNKLVQRHSDLYVNCPKLPAPPTLSFWPSSYHYCICCSPFSLWAWVSKNCHGGGGCYFRWQNCFGYERVFAADLAFSRASRKPGHNVPKPRKSDLDFGLLKCCDGTDSQGVSSLGHWVNVCHKEHKRHMSLSPGETQCFTPWSCSLAWKLKMLQKCLLANSWSQICKSHNRNYPPKRNEVKPTHTNQECFKFCHTSHFKCYIICFFYPLCICEEVRIQGGREAVMCSNF